MYSLENFYAEKSALLS